MSDDAARRSSPPAAPTYEAYDPYAHEAARVQGLAAPAVPFQRTPPVAPPPVDQTGWPTAPSFHRRRARNISGIVVRSLVVLVIVGAAVGAWLSRPLWSQHPATLTAPDAIVGLPRHAEPEISEPVRTALHQLTLAGLKGTVYATYGEQRDPGRRFVLVAGSGLVLFPARELDGFFAAVAGGVGPETDVRDVPPGDLGGYLRCGRLAAADPPATVCAWSDHGSLGAAVFYNRDVHDSIDLIRAVRGAVVSR